MGASPSSEAPPLPPPSFGDSSGQSRRTPPTPTLYGLPEMSDSEEFARPSSASASSSSNALQGLDAPDFELADPDDPFTPAADAEALTTEGVGSDPGRHNEVDLSAAGDAPLELDLPQRKPPAPFRSPSTPAPPAAAKPADRPPAAPAFRPPPLDDADLPAPAAPRARPQAKPSTRPSTPPPLKKPPTPPPSFSKPPAPPPPTPAKPKTPPPPAFSKPAPPPPPNFGPPPAEVDDGPVTDDAYFGPPPADEDEIGGFGLDAEPDIDLPAPKVSVAPPPSLAHASEGDEADLLAPVELDLPAPKGSAAASTAPDDLDLDLPAPLELDLPAPAEDLPAPVDELPAPKDSDFDYSAPLELDLPEPKETQLEPARTDLEPARTDLEPARTDLEPARTELEPKDTQLEPRREMEPLGQPRTAGPETQSKPTLSGAPSPTYAAIPGPASRPAVSRGVIYGGLAAVVLVLGGVGVLYSGILDPEPPQSVTRGMPGANEDEDDEPAGPAKPRDEAVLQALALDTPEGYENALAAARSNQDRVGRAEAALLQHYRYGPEPVLLGEADGLLEPYQGEKEPFVARVLGLDALARGDLKTAQTHLTADEPRTSLYRGWLLLEQGKLEEANEAAERAYAGEYEQTAATALQYEIALAQGALDLIGDVERALASHEDHPGLRRTLAEMSIARGQLATAQTALERLRETSGLPKAYLAEVDALQAEVLRQRGEPRRALAKTQEALEAAPGLLEAQLIEVRALSDTKAMADAGRVIDEVVEKHPQSRRARELDIRIALDTGDAEAALRGIDALQKLSPEDAKVPYYTGLVHAMRLELDEASKAFGLAIEKDPDLYEANIAKSRMLAAARRPADALAALDEGIARMEERGGGRPLGELLFIKAELLLDQGQAAESFVALDRALQAAPDHNDALLQRGVSRLERGEFDAGRADLETLYERTGGWPGLTLPLGRLFARNNELDKLQTLLGERLSDPKADPAIKIVGARLRLAQGRPEDAKVLADEALAMSAGNWEAQMLLARAFLDAGDPAQALEQIVRVEPRTPKAEVFLLKGKILEFNARHEDARPEYLKALQLDPNLHEARFLYGRLLAYSGAPKQAILELERVVEATSEYPEAWLNLGRAHRELGERDQALEALGRAIELEAGLVEAYYLQGRIFVDQNQHAKAIAALERATEAVASDRPWYPDALMTLGRAQVKAGRNQAAKASFERFLEVAPPGHVSRPAAERELRDLG